MDTIPTEILHEVFSYIPERDLGSIRLVNTVFNNAANYHYFRTIRVSFTKATIENLIHLCHQPHVARCVWHLEYPYRLESQFLPYSDEERRSQEAAPRDIFDVLKFCFSRMPNIREITTYLDEIKPIRSKLWPQPSTNEDKRVFCATFWNSIDLDAAPWERPFTS
ncbi:hypothetical protein RUND412_003216 [Rhizina undulata]